MKNHLKKIVSLFLIIIITCSLTSFVYADASNYGLHTWALTCSDLGPTYYDADGSFTLGWDISGIAAYVKSFQVYYLNPAGTYIHDSPTTSTSVSGSYSISELESGKYYFTIIAYAYRDESDNYTTTYYSRCTIEVAETSIIRPDYKILSIIYAPPGTEGGGSGSSVSYGTESSLGSSTSVSNTLKSQHSNSITAGVIFVSGTSDFSTSKSSTNAEVLNFNKKDSWVLKQPGPSVDGIDHNRDQILLWLGPKLKFADFTTGKVEWTVDGSEKMNVQPVYVGHLRNPSSMPSNVAALLATYNIMTDDYQDILDAYPFANENTQLDTNRFKPLEQSFPYIPPYAPGDTPLSVTFNSSYSSGYVSSSSVESQHSTGMSIELGCSKLMAKLKYEDRFTWTDVDTRSNSSSTSETASVTISGPSYGYTGPTLMDVYFDTIYKTFAFVPAEVSSSVCTKGTIENLSSEDLFGQEVVVIADGKEYCTYTNLKGEYIFNKDFSKAKNVQLYVNGKKINSVPLNNNVNNLYNSIESNIYGELLRSFKN